MKRWTKTVGKKIHKSYIIIIIIFFIIEKSFTHFLISHVQNIFAPQVVYTIKKYLKLAINFQENISRLKWKGDIVMKI